MVNSKRRENEGTGIHSSLRLTKENLADFLNHAIDYQHVEELTFSSDLYITSLPDEICSLKALKKLTSSAKLESLPESIGNLVNLEELQLWFNGLTFLPDSLCKLPNLKVLNINDNHIRMLPAEFGKLSNLTEFKMENNPKFTEFPGSFSHLKNLKILKISYSGTPYIQEAFTNLAELRTFQLDQYQLYEFPASVARALRNQGCHINAYFSRRDEGGDSEWVLEELDDGVMGISFWCRG